MILGTMNAWFVHSKLDDFDAKVWSHEFSQWPMGSIIMAMDQVKQSGARFMPSLPEFVAMMQGPKRRLERLYAFAVERLTD